MITSTAVYWTNQLEVWSALSSKERAYDQVISCAKQYIRKNTPDSLKLQVSIRCNYTPLQWMYPSTTHENRMCLITKHLYILQVQKVQDDKLLLCATVNQYYNQGVMSTFSGVSNLPSTICGLYNKAVQQLNTPPAAASTAKKA